MAAAEQKSKNDFGILVGSSGETQRDDIVPAELIGYVVLTERD